MRFIPIEHLRNCFPIIRCESRDIHQGLYSLIFRRPDNGTGIGVSSDNHRPLSSRDGSLQRRRIIA
jgi:hypothetical protein